MRASAVLRSVIYRTLAVALAVLAVLSTIMPAPAYAADTDQQVKTVRVGWLVSNEGFQNGTPGERLSGWGYEYLQTLSYYTPAGSTNTSPAPSLSLWTCSRRARSTSCPTSPTPRNAPKSCSFPRTPRAPSATSSTPSPIETIWPRVTPSAPRPYHRLQPRRYANLRWPAVARQRRHYLHL